tara:strand:- start:165 stop:644 length:480 start_codon:yes stop_codon:yes gene_type:complete
MNTNITIEIDHDTFDLAANYEAACSFGSWRGGGFYILMDQDHPLLPFLDEEDRVIKDGLTYMGIRWKQAEELYRKGKDIYTFCIDHTTKCYDDFHWDDDFIEKHCQATKINKQTVTEALNKVAAQPDWWVCQELMADNGDSVCWDCLFQYIDYGDVIYG